MATGMKTCDICGKEIINPHIRQKRHRGECHREFMKRYAQTVYYGGYNSVKKERKERKAYKSVKTVVKCPGCQKTHIVESQVDRAKRVYCLECEPSLNEYAYAEGM